MELIGRLKRLNDVQVISDTFSKRQFVVETQEQYPQSIPFDLVKGNVTLLDNTPLNTLVRVQYRMSGRDWTSPTGEVKTFLTLEAFAVDANLEAPTQTSTQSTPLTSGIDKFGIPSTPQATQQIVGDDDDDLPF